MPSATKHKYEKNFNNKKQYRTVAKAEKRTNDVTQTKKDGRALVYYKK